MIFDLAIIGGGPAAVGAAVYAGRKQLKTIVVAEEIGGQSAVSETIFNWIGTKAIGGNELANALKAHMEEYTKESGTLTLQIGKRVNRVVEDDSIGFTLTLGDGSTVQAKAVLVATGSSHRKLDVPGATEFDNKGIMYCATCDGPLFSGMPVAVLGGGNAAFEAAIQLTQYTDNVTLIHRNENFRADPITINAVKGDPKIKVITNAQVSSIEGSSLVEKLNYKINGSDEIHSLNVSGVFVEIGQIPNTDLVTDLCDLDKNKKIVINPKNQRTNIDGLWAAGDCTDGHYHQNNIAVGDGVRALEDIYIWLKTGK